jgi:hypothetical protein
MLTGIADFSGDEHLATAIGNWPCDQNRSQEQVKFEIVIPSRIFGEESAFG